MYTTVFRVKCKTRKCGKAIVIDKPFAQGEVRELKCSQGHLNKYDQSNLETRTAIAQKLNGVVLI